MKTAAPSRDRSALRRGALALLLAWVCLGAGARLSTAAPLTPETLRELNRQGEDFFRQANHAAATNREKALDLYQKALLRFERIVREGGIENGKLYYNIGNCYFRMNDLGRAILNYRRALRYIPNDPNLQQNLNYARSRRLDKIEVKARTRILRTLLFWHYDFSMRTRAVLFTASFVLLWIMLAFRLFFRRASLTWIAAALGGVALLMATSVLAQDISTHREKPGVVVADEVTARKGDSSAYEPSFKEPLHAGAEFVLLQRRGDWLYIELMDGRRCWIPARSAEWIG